MSMPDVLTSPGIDFHPSGRLLPSQVVGLTGPEDGTCPYCGHPYTSGRWHPNIRTEGNLVQGDDDVLSNGDAIFVPLVVQPDYCLAIGQVLVISNHAKYVVR